MFDLGSVKKYLDPRETVKTISRDPTSIFTDPLKDVAGLVQGAPEAMQGAYGQGRDFMSMLPMIMGGTNQNWQQPFGALFGDADRYSYKPLQKPLSAYGNLGAGTNNMYGMLNSRWS